MTRHFAIVLFCALPALPQGGAIPKGASAYQPLEVSNVRWLSPPTAKEAAVFRKGNLMIDGEEGFTLLVSKRFSPFLPENLEATVTVSDAP